MNTMQLGVIALLKSAVTQQNCILPPDFDLETAYPQLKRHHMASLIYEGAVLCGIPTDTPLMRHLFKSYCKSLLISEGQMREVDRIYKAFEENGIDYLPLKGCNMKTLYPKPELRTMGDADILIRMEQYDQIIPIMESLNFEAGIETDHELQWYNNALFVELHKRLIPSRNKDFYAYFGEGWRLATHRETHRYSMEPEDEMVYQFTHFAKHYRAGGIGCRHVVDLWLFLTANPTLNEEKVKKELDKLQLREFYENIRQLIAVWFDEVPSNEKIDFITDFIFASGSWGRIETKIVSAAIRVSKKNDHSKTRLVYLRHLIFPSVEALHNKYTILQKAPWMLPFVWLYRPFYILICERQALKRSQIALQELTPDKVCTHHEALQYVGLDYHF